MSSSCNTGTFPTYLNRYTFIIYQFKSTLRKIYNYYLVLNIRVTLQSYSMLKGIISLAVIDITWQIIISISEPFSLKVLIECSLCWFTSNHNLIYMRLSSNIIVKPITLTDVRWLYRLGFHPSGIYKPIFCYFYNFFPLINQSSSFSSYHIHHSPSTLPLLEVCWL